MGAAATLWLMTHDTEFCQRGTEKLFPPCDKCHSCGGDCVGPKQDRGTIKAKLSVLQLNLDNTDIRIVNLLVFSTRPA
jgi:hypothetical protein